MGILLLEKKIFEDWFLKYVCLFVFTMFVYKNRNIGSKEWEKKNEKSSCIHRPPQQHEN